MSQYLSDLVQSVNLRKDLRRAEQCILQGEHEAALRAYRSALKTAEGTDGADSPVVGDICYILSGLYEAVKKNPQKSIEMLARAYKITVAELGSTAVETGKILYNLGRLYLQAGNDKRAAGAFIRALEILEKEMGSGHPVVASILNNMGDIYENNGERRKALEYYIKARRILAASSQADPDELARLNGKLRRLGAFKENSEMTQL